MGTLITGTILFAVFLIVKYIDDKVQKSTNTTN